MNSLLPNPQQLDLIKVDLYILFLKIKSLSSKKLFSGNGLTFNFINILCKSSSFPLKIMTKQLSILAPYSLEYFVMK